MIAFARPPLLTIAENLTRARSIPDYTNTNLKCLAASPAGPGLGNNKLICFGSEVSVTVFDWRRTCSLEVLDTGFYSLKINIQSSSFFQDFLISFRVTETVSCQSTWTCPTTCSKPPPLSYNRQGHRWLTSKTSTCHRNLFQTWCYCPLCIEGIVRPQAKWAPGFAARQAARLNF